jgi:hypothetical protein
MRLSTIFGWLDAIMGMMVTFFVALALAGLYAIGGAPKQYEIDALGGAYVDFLAAVESSARDLRNAYCNEASGEASLAAKCVNAPAG